MGWLPPPLALALLTLTAGGCLNFQEPGELGARRGDLQVQIVLTDTTAATAELQARLARERREDGTYRPLADSTLRALGRAVAPDSAGDPGILFYGDEWTLTPEQRARPELELRGPLPADGGSRVSVAVPRVSRAGPGAVVLGAGQDLSLPLDPGSETRYQNVWSMSWTLVVEREGAEASLFSLRSSGRPPDTLRIPRELLEPDAGDARRTVTFWVRMEAGPAADSPAHDLRLGLTTVLGWTVTVD